MKQPWREFLLFLVDLVAPEKKAQEPEPLITKEEAKRAVIQFENRYIQASRRAKRNQDVWIAYLDDARPFRK